MTTTPDEAGTHAFRVFLIADVRGYSSFADQRGDEAAASLAQRFLDVATEVITENHGEITGTRGDEVVAAFESPRSAIRASLALQRRFFAETERVPELPLPVGIGLDMGEVVVVADGYRGNAINVAARLCAIAPAGSVLATREVVHVAQAVEGVHYDPRPSIPLKGIAEPVQYARIVDVAEDTMAAYSRIGRTQAATPPIHRRALWRRPVVLAVSGLVLFPLIVLVAVNVRGATSSAAIYPDGLAALSTTGGVLESVRLAGHPTELAGGFGSEWVTSTTTDQLFRVDWKTATVTPIPVGSQPEGVAVGAGAVWVADSGDGTVDRVSPQSNTVVARIVVGTGPDCVTVFANSVWVTNSLSATVSEIDPAQNAVVRTITTGAEPAGVAGGDGALWVVDEGNATVQELDPSTGEQVSAPISVGKGPTAVVFGAGAAWVTNTLDGTLSRIDPADDGVITSLAEAGAEGVAIAGDRVWVSNEDAGTLSEFSSADANVRTLAVSSAPTGLDYSDGRLWVTSDGVGAQVHGGGVLVVDSALLNGSSDPPYAIDPGFAYTAGQWRILIMTNDGLVGYRRVGGLAGASLVPDLATFIPSPTNGGLTYTFQLRRGIRYSTGQPVVASDFRYALERAFKIARGPLEYFTTLVGGAQCNANPATCSLARGVASDDRTGKVTFHLVKPDPDFLDQLALPIADAVPLGTPYPPVGGTVPATGPYMVLSYRPAEVSSATNLVTRPGRVVLVRNRFFRQWSAAAQPAGFPDRIVITTGLPVATEIQEVGGGKADAMWDSPSVSQYSQMEADFPDQIYLISQPATSYFWLNTRVPPFSSLAVRRAVNLALDRHRFLLGAAADQTFGGAITCQVLPPDFPSYSRYCPYTLDPSASGNWIAPDLATAQSLVAGSGMRSVRVTIAAPVGLASPEQYDLLGETLRRLGFAVRIEIFPLLTQAEFLHYLVATNDPGTRIQAGPSAWQSDYIAASNFFEPLLTCDAYVPSTSTTSLNLNPGGFCDPTIDKLIARALAAQQSNSGAAVSDWTEIDHDLVDQAPWVSIANSENIDFVSRRVGDYQYNPQFGELADLLWVR